MLWSARVAMYQDMTSSRLEHAHHRVGQFATYIPACWARPYASFGTAQTSRAKIAYDSPMSYRDELNAACARIDALEADVERLTIALDLAARA